MDTIKVKVLLYRPLESIFSVDLLSRIEVRLWGNIRLVYCPSSRLKINFNKIKRTRKGIIKLFNKEPEQLQVETQEIKVFEGYNCKLISLSFDIFLNYYEFLRKIKLEKEQRDYLEEKHDKIIRCIVSSRKPFIGPSQMKLRANHYYGKCKR